MPGGDAAERLLDDPPAQRLHPTAAGLRVATFTGGYGSQEAAARWRLNASTVAVETTRVLSFREGLTVAVGWNPGVVRRPLRDWLPHAALAASVLLPALGWRMWWGGQCPPARLPLT